MTPSERRQLLIKLRPWFRRRARIEERLEREVKRPAPVQVASAKERERASDRLAIERAHRAHLRGIAR